MNVKNYGKVWTSEIKDFAQYQVRIYLVPTENVEYNIFNF